MAAALVTVLVATGLVLVLSAVVLAARGLLMPGGEATLTINGRRQLAAARGDKLLWTLAGNGILLPAACGGRGSCGQCRVVVDGAGPPLPVEEAMIGRRQAAAGERLACMVTVRHDLDVRVPETVLDARQLTATVESNVSITALLKELTLALPAGESFEFEAGDYVLIEAPAGETRFADFEIAAAWHDTWTRQDLWRLAVTRRQAESRAYSLASAPSADGRLQLVIRIALPPPGAGSRIPPGRVSSWLFGLAAGDPVRMSGPFGDFHVRDSGAEMVFVGGGAGIAPLRSMIRDQLVNRGSRRRISLWYGARDVGEVCYRGEFDALAAEFHNFRWTVALSDPRASGDWQGPRGFIHAVLRDDLVARHDAPEEVEYYLCGPPLMSAAVVAMLEDYGVAANNILYDDFGT